MTKRPTINKKNVNVTKNSAKSFEFTNVKQGKAHKVPEPKANKLSIYLSSLKDELLDAKQALSKVQPRAIIISILIIILIGVFFFPKKDKIADVNYLSSNVSAQMDIPIYLPTEIGEGYTLNNDARAIKHNILNFTVTSPSNHKYSVTQQEIPLNFDFTNFNKKFNKPDIFNADSGYVVVGQVGSNLIGSVRTNKNTWIIVNGSSVSASTINELESIIRSFELLKYTTH